MSIYYSYRINLWHRFSYLKPNVQILIISVVISGSKLPLISLATHLLYPFVIYQYPSFYLFLSSLDKKKKGKIPSLFEICDNGSCNSERGYTKKADPEHCIKLASSALTSSEIRGWRLLF